jgi:arylsulfatase A-like enzyme
MHRPNVILLCVDSLRKDAYDRFAPRLSDKATYQFEEMRAMSSWSVPSHAAMFTGKLPSEIGVHTHQRRFDGLSTDQTLISAMREYHTVGFSANVYASPVFGFDTLFDDFKTVSAAQRLPDGMDVRSFIKARDDDGLRSYLAFVRAALNHDYPVQSLANGCYAKLERAMLTSRFPFANPFDDGGAALCRALTKSVSDDADRPVFAFANLMDVHGPHAVFRGLNRQFTANVDANFSTHQFDAWDVCFSDDSTEYSRELEQFRTLYHGSVDYLDRLLTDTIETIRAQTSRDTIIILTADHGENLGYRSDDGLIDHRSSLSEGLLHVPFDIITPETHTETVPDLSSHEALHEILNAVLNSDDPTIHTTDRAYAEIVGPGAKLPASAPNKRFWKQGQRAVYADGVKYLRTETGDEQVYTIGRAPSWQALQDGPFRPERFDRFGEWVGDTNHDPTPVDSDVAARLADLGYR